MMPLEPRSTPDLEQAIDRHPLVVSPDTLLRDAIALMSQSRGSCSLMDDDSALALILSEARASCVVVIQEAQLVGIVTEREIVQLTAAGISLEGVRVTEVMTQQVTTLKLSQCQDLFAVLTLFRQHQIRHLPIVDEQEQLLGLITPESIRPFLQPTDLLRLRTLSEVMIAQVVQAPMTVTVLRLAELMAEHRVSCVVIVEERATRPDPSIAASSDFSPTPLVYPIGMVTERDLVQFHALELDFLQVQAQNVMSSPLFCLSPDDSLWNAHQEMLVRRVQRLVVTGDQGELLGIVTQSSLIQTLDPIELYDTVTFLQQKVYQLEIERIELL
ncbi:MAG: CBS domain-containing protein, partial [Leptolyngbyaceae bacterium]|nr:CBS domain-containing protein [Leptolyngbyaceae bacterium]